MSRFLARRVINHDGGGRYIVCAWDDCERDGVELHKIRSHEHLRNVSCEDVDVGAALGRHITFVFCSERHRLYWLNATGTNATRSLESTGRAYGNLPVGSRGTIQ